MMYRVSENKYLYSITICVQFYVILDAIYSLVQETAPLNN